MLTTQVWTLFQFPPRVGPTAALALPTLMVTIVLLWLQRRVLGRRSFVTLTGKGGARRTIRLGWAK